MTNPLEGAPIERPDEPELVDSPPCSKCGGTMPPMSVEMVRLARAHGGVVLAHEVCPGQEPSTPGRYFEVRVQIVEVTEERVTVGGDTEPVVTELISFVAGHRDVDLDTAMRPLALALGEKWTKAEKQARLADGVAL